MHWLVGFPLLAKPEFRLLIFAKTGPALDLHNEIDMQGRQAPQIERFAFFVVGDNQAYVINYHITSFLYGASQKTLQRFMQPLLLANLN